MEDDVAMADSALANRFLVIGCGSIGKRHLKNLHDLGARDLIAVDTRPERRAEAADLSGARTFGDLRSALDLQPTVVFVTTPTSSHVELATEVARRGCHLFIEKPLSDRETGIGDLIREVDRRRLVTLVGCNIRFHPGIAQIKDLIVSGAVGKVVAARIEAGRYLPDWHPDQDYRRRYSALRDQGGGTILDAIHEIDYACWLLGDVVRVAAFAGTLSSLEIETEDTAALLLMFAGGSIGELHLDYVQRVYSRSCHVIGERGTIRWENDDNNVRWYSADDGRWHVLPLASDWNPNQMYVDELRHFLDCLEGRTRPLADVETAYKVLKVALAAREAAMTCRVIALGGAGV